MLDVIICANFDSEKLSGLGNTGGQILSFPIETIGHPYNSAALLRSLWKDHPHHASILHRYGASHIKDNVKMLTYLDTDSCFVVDDNGSGWTEISNSLSTCRRCA